MGTGKVSGLRGLRAVREFRGKSVGHLAYKMAALEKYLADTENGAVEWQAVFYELNNGIFKRRAVVTGVVDVKKLSINADYIDREVDSHPEWWADLL